MRISFVLPYAGLSGGARVLAIYADRLQRRRHEVTVTSLPYPRRTLERKLKSVLRGKGWPRDPDPEPSYFDSIDVPHKVLETSRPIVDADLPDADVVLATFWATAPWVAALSPSKGAKAIFLQGHEISPGQENPEIDSAWRLPLHKIVISKWLAELARDRFGDSNVHLVPNSVDTEQFNAPARGMQRVPTVGMLYGTSRAKGVDVGVAALEHAKKKLPNLRAIVFGAERVSGELPLPNWVEFLYRPPQGKISELYAQCDVWMCSSRREGFGLPLLEAMACRCPVVSTKCGGPLDFVDHGKNGYLVESEDAGALADRLVQVVSFREAEWIQMSQNALETATRYSWDDATDLLEKAFRETIAATP